MIGIYEDSYSLFPCLILACSLNGDQYLIRDTNENVTGVCSTSLVDADNATNPLTYPYKA